MLVQTLTHHPLITAWLKLTATTIGRDKLLRTLQYFSRFLAWYLYRTNRPATSIAPFEAIKKQFGLTRKILRMGKFIEHFKAAAVASEVKDGDSVVQALTVGRQLGYAGYLSMDLLTVPDAIGAWKSIKAKEWGLQAYRFWAAGLGCSVLNGIYGLSKLREREAGLNKEDGESAVQRKLISKQRAALNLQLISDLCDLTVPTSALAWTKFDDGFVGLAGTTSSLIGLYGVWKKASA